MSLALILAAPLSQAADNGDQDGGLDRPVTSREIEQLKQEISDQTHSSIEGIFGYHTESGDLNNRLDFLRYGLRLNYRAAPGVLLYVRGVNTSYLTKGRVIDEQGTNVSGGVRLTLSERAALEAEGGATRFSTDTTTVNARGSLEVRPTDSTSLHITGSRTNVEESLLSAAGIRPAVGPFAGKLVGAVMDNRVTAGVRQKLFPRFELFGEGGGGTRTGRNIQSNSFRQGSGGAGYDIIARDNAPLTLVRASYQLDYFGFDKNLLGYGGASLLNGRGVPIPLTALGGDGDSPLAAPGHPGAGGYFSPDYFLSNVGRLEIQGRPSPAFDYRLSGFAGVQNYTGTDRRQASGFSATISFHLTDRISLPVTYLYDNFGPFTQHTALARLVFRL